MIRFDLSQPLPFWVRWKCFWGAKLYLFTSFQAGLEMGPGYAGFLKPRFSVKFLIEGHDPQALERVILDFQREVSRRRVLK